jgi:hypothetical protein
MFCFNKLLKEFESYLLYIKSPAAQNFPAFSLVVSLNTALPVSLSV